MGGNNFKSIGEIWMDMQYNTEKVHEHNIERLIQEFGKDNESEVKGIYNMERDILEKNNSIPLEFIPVRIYEQAQKTLYFNNPDHIPIDNFLSNEYI